MSRAPASVLVGLSNTRPWESVVEAALEAASQSRPRGLWAVYVVELPQIEGLTERLMGEGWVTQAGAGGLTESLGREAALQGDMVLSQLAERAEAADLPFSGEVVEGDFAEIMIQSSQREGLQGLLVPRRLRLGLSRLLFGSPVREIEEHSGVPVAVIEEGLRP